MTNDETIGIDLYDKTINSLDSDAMFNLACTYEEEAEEYLQDEDKNLLYDKVITLYKRAIDLGNSDAMVNLAYIYQNGLLRCTKNESAAIALYQRAIALKNSAAMFNLACIYQNGLLGCAKDDEAAIALYQQAIELENSDAMVNLGCIYYQKGLLGCEQAESAAIDLYNRAIALGNSAAMFNLASILCEKASAWDEAGEKEEEAIECYKHASHLFKEATRLRNDDAKEPYEALFKTQGRRIIKNAFPKFFENFKNEIDKLLESNSFSMKKIGQEAQKVSAEVEKQLQLLESVDMDYLQDLIGICALITYGLRFINKQGSFQYKPCCYGEEQTYDMATHKKNMERLKVIADSLKGAGWRNCRNSLLILAGAMLVAAGIVATVATGGVSLAATFAGVAILTAGAGFFAGRDTGFVSAVKGASIRMSDENMLASRIRP